MEFLWHWYFDVRENTANFSSNSIGPPFCLWSKFIKYFAQHFVGFLLVEKTSWIAIGRDFDTRKLMIDFIFGETKTFVQFHKTLFIVWNSYLIFVHNVLYVSCPWLPKIRIHVVIEHNTFGQYRFPSIRDGPVIFGLYSFIIASNHQIWVNFAFFSLHFQSKWAISFNLLQT